uniref:Uncharacterized protein n=1 Tax=Pipistrellus kuhlii TaxID=59472 RepID=A0A7J7ZJR9_PIPKU|nr:hypothetical protein mPipKuh1_009620 [Pipistrellus kuhlii]
MSVVDDFSHEQNGANAGGCSLSLQNCRFFYFKLDIASILCLLVLTKIFTLDETNLTTHFLTCSRYYNLDERLQLEPLYCLKCIVRILGIFIHDFNLAGLPSGRRQPKSPVFQVLCEDSRENCMPHSTLRVLNHRTSITLYTHLLTCPSVPRR